MRIKDTIQKFLDTNPELLAVRSEEEAKAVRYLADTGFPYCWGAFHHSLEECQRQAALAGVSTELLMSLQWDFDELEAVVWGSLQRRNESRGVTAPITSVTVFDWKQRRSNGETVEDQMLLIFRNDARSAEWSAAEWAKELDCSVSSVKKQGNKVWEMLLAEKERRRRLLAEKCGYQ